MSLCLISTILGTDSLLNNADVSLSNKQANKQIFVNVVLVMIGGCHSRLGVVFVITVIRLTHFTKNKNNNHLNVELIKESYF